MDKLIKGYKNKCDFHDKEWISQNKTTICPKCKKENRKIYSYTQEPIINY